jgi:hypothetical protein
MSHLIDVSAVLRRTVADHFSDLVTRPTGAAVRTQIEAQLLLSTSATVVIDFSAVGLLDFSCADEVVAKLLLRHAADSPEAGDPFFLFRGVSDSHLDAIEAVLERHGLALVAEPSDGPRLVVGALDPLERVAWEAISRLGSAAPADVADAAGCAVADAEDILEGLRRRRLVRRRESHYLTVWEEGADA